jgi:hypothetical protein
MSPWDVVVAYWRNEIVEYLKKQGIDTEKLDTLGEEIDMYILPDVLSGTPLPKAVWDWVDWWEEVN